LVGIQGSDSSRDLSKRKEKMVVLLEVEDSQVLAGDTGSDNRSFVGHKVGP
jgi:hypothetical protein